MSEPTPRLWLTDRVLLIATVALVAMLLLAAGIAWWVTHQPPLRPIEVPSVKAA